VSKIWNHCLRIIGFSTLGVFATFAGQHARGSAPEGKSAEAPNPVILVELFTSEGCSSCPPADSLLAQINGMHAASGQLVIGIGEHVTYWNHQGWIDPYSDEAYTDRQTSYADRFHLRGPYTPQMVVNGSQEFVGNDRRTLLNALDKENKPGFAQLHILSTTVEDDALMLSFSLAGSLPREGADIIAVLTDDDDHSNVLRGENSGRSLSHVAVARSFIHIAKVHSAVERTTKLPLPASFLSDRTRGHHLVLFVQAANLGAVLGTDTKPL